MVLEGICFSSEDFTTEVPMFHNERFWHPDLANRPHYRPCLSLLVVSDQPDVLAQIAELAGNDFQIHVANCVATALGAR